MHAHPGQVPTSINAPQATGISLVQEKTAVCSRPDVVERVMERVDDAVQTVAPDSSRSSRKVTCSALLPLLFQWHACCLVLFQWLTCCLVLFDWVTCCSCACSHWPIC